MSLTYSSYLDLERLLAAQRPRSEPPEHDEYLFIIAHQTFELWFKLLLIEFEKVCRDFEAGDTFAAIATFKRARAVMGVLNEQMHVLETLTPMQFNSFRDRLERASGFQSIQFRELEFLLGYKRPDMLRFYEHDAAGHERMTTRLREPSVNDKFHRFLTWHGVGVPLELLQRDPTLPATTHPGLEEQVVQLYHTRPDLVILFELMTDFDQLYQEWRYRHVKLVERTIGNKHGTGGSLGVEFLKKALFKHAFPVLWAIRHRL